MAGYSCDACANPYVSRASCAVSKPASCRKSGCDWYKNLDRTLGLRLVIKVPSGWGNYWPTLRLLHLLAAALGRRLLLSSRTFRLPARQFSIGGDVPWVLRSNRAEKHHILSRRAVVLSESELLPPFSSESMRRREWEMLVRPAIIRKLASAEVASARHVWLNLTSWKVESLLAAGQHFANPKFGLPDCQRDPKVEWVAACIDRLVTTPVAGSSLAAKHVALRKRLPADGNYVGVHVRTLATDFKIWANWSAALRDVPADPSATIRLLAWDMNVTVDSYLSILKGLCREGKPPLFVASDSKSVARAFAAHCPPNRILSSASIGEAAATQASDLARLAASPSAAAAGGIISRSTWTNVGMDGHRGLALDGPLLDWIALAEAGLGSGRFGHDSTFHETAVVRGRFCAGPQVGLIPKPWARRRRINTFNLWNALRRASECYESAEDCTTGRRGNAVRLHQTGFPGTPCEGLRTILDCARLLYAGLLSTRV